MVSHFIDFALAGCEGLIYFLLQVVKASNGIRRSKYLRQSDPNMAEGCVEEQGNG